jgi:hypothetical protein
MKILRVPINSVDLPAASGLLGASVNQFFDRGYQ